MLEIRSQTLAHTVIQKMETTIILIVINIRRIIITMLVLADIISIVLIVISVFAVLT